MPDTRISELPAAIPADGTEQVPVVQGTTTRRASPAALLAGAVIPGRLAVRDAPQRNNDLIRKAELDAVQALAAAALPKSGGTMTGQMVLAGDATAALHPTSLQQVEAMIARAIASLPASGPSADTILLPGGSRVAEFGHSFIRRGIDEGNAQRLMSWSTAGWARYFLDGGYELDDSLNFGVGGDTLQQMRARIGTVLAAAGSAPAVHFDGGINDVREGVSLADMKTRWTDIVAQLSGAFSLVFIQAIAPAADGIVASGASNAEGRQKILDFNAWASAYCRPRPKLVWVGGHEALLDEATGKARTDMVLDGDGVHLTQRGAATRGRVLADAMASHLPGQGWLARRSRTPWSSSNRSGNKLVLNTHWETTSGGSKDPHIEGADAPQHWQVHSEPSNTGTVSLSYEAAPDGVGNALVITLNRRSGTDEVISIEGVCFQRDGSYQAGEWVQDALGVEVSNTINLSHPYLEINDWDGNFVARSSHALFPYTREEMDITGPHAGTLTTMRRQLIPITGAFDPRQDFLIRIPAFGSRAGGASGTIKLWRPTIGLV